MFSVTKKNISDRGAALTVVRICPVDHTSSPRVKMQRANFFKGARILIHLVFLYTREWDFYIFEKMTRINVFSIVYEIYFSGMLSLNTHRNI